MASKGASLGTMPGKVQSSVPLQGSGRSNMGVGLEGDLGTSHRGSLYQVMGEALCLSTWP